MCVYVVVVVVVVVVSHHLQPAGPTPNPAACGHMTSPHTPRSPVLVYVLAQRGSTTTRARRLLLLPVEPVYPPILKTSISSQHQHNTLPRSKYGADRQRVKKRPIPQGTAPGLPTWSPTVVVLTWPDAA